MQLKGQNHFLPKGKVGAEKDDVIFSGELRKQA